LASRAWAVKLIAVTFREAIRRLHVGDPPLAVDNPNQIGYMRRLSQEEGRTIHARKMDAGGWEITAGRRQRKRPQS
jgi:hypothetical protein